MARHAYPADPATMIDAAVITVLCRDLDLGYPSDALLDPVMAARVMTMLAETIRVWTGRGGAS